MNYKITPVEEKDHQRLSDIAFAAKSYWDYPLEYLELWKDDLTIKTDYIAKNNLFKLLNEQQDILGFIAIEQQDASIDINHLWVDPPYIGHGLGRQLIEHAFNFAQAKSIDTITVLSDPNAKTFYEKFGFITIEKIESLPKGRFLPRMKKNLVPA